MGCHFSFWLTATLEINWTKIKGGCQSGRKVVTDNSKSDLPLVCTWNWFLFKKVPGRLGLLVTLDLIATNVYNSVNAPKNRGFSYIEVWFLGVQIPILVAIFEYGALLMAKRYLLQKNMTSNMVTPIETGWLNNFDMNSISKVVDRWTFIMCLIFITIFNAIYWLLVLWNK